MDPVSMMMGATSLIGLGMSIFGSTDAAANSSAIAQDSSAIGGLDIKVNQQKQQQMVLQANRSQLQNIRNTQLARSQALTGATSQGAQFGTGLQGGLAQIEGQSTTNAVNTSQNLAIGQNIFGLDNQIDRYRMDIASRQGNQATDQGIASLGGSLMKGAGPLSSLFGNFFGSSKQGTGGQMNVSGQDSPGFGPW